MKKTLHFTKKIFLLGLLIISSISNAQHFTATLANFVHTANTFEVDVVLIIDAPVRLSNFSTGIYYNPGILNGGVPCTTPNCGSLEYIPGTRSTELLPLNATENTNFAGIVGHLRIVHTPYLSAANAIDIQPGTFTLGRYRFINTVPWTLGANVNLWLSPNNAGGAAVTVVGFYQPGTISGLYAYSTTIPSPANPGVTLGYTQSNPLSRLLATPQNNVNPLQVYPNPFITNFNLSFETVSNEQISVKVYDMIGKLIDNSTVEANVINTIQMGENYQSGIYNVSVSQGEKVQNIRVIKK